MVRSCKAPNNEYVLVQIDRLSRLAVKMTERAQAQAERLTNGGPNIAIAGS